MNAATWILAVGLLGTFAFFHHEGGFNQNTRFDLTRAIVEHGTIAIDAYHANTLDKAYREGHYYCDKPPGTSWLAVPGYAAARAVVTQTGKDPDAAETLRWTFYAGRVASVSLAGCALAAVFLRTLAFLCTPGWAVLVTAGLALGTLVFPYSTLFYGHQIAATCLFWSFSVLFEHRRRSERSPAALALAGMTAGAGAVADYPAFLLVALLGAYALTGSSRLRTVSFFAAGTALPILALLAYHDAAFGSPFSTGFAHEVLPHWRSQYGAGFYGMRVPSGEALYQLTLGARRGLLYGSPWLVLALPGLWRLAFVRRWWAEAALVGASLAVLLALNAALHSWEGGWTMGPRYLTPAVPFVAFAAAFAEGRLVRVLAVPLIATSVVFMLAGAAVMPEVPVFVLRPFLDFLLPYFFSGRLSVADPGGAAFNLGEALAGLEGLASLLPLLALWCVAAAGLIAAVRRRGSWPPVDVADRPAAGRIVINPR